MSWIVDVASPRARRMTTSARISAVDGGQRSSTFGVFSRSAPETIVRSMHPDFQPSRRHARDGERGAALAELAMVVPIMLALLLVVFDLGRGFLAYIAVSDAARDGARVAMLYDLPCTDPSVQPAVRTAAQNTASPHSVTVVVTVPATDRCSVRVNHTYTPILPFVTSSFTLPGMGTVGPLWNGTMSETMVS